MWTHCWIAKLTEWIFFQSQCRYLLLDTQGQVSSVHPITKPKPQDTASVEDHVCIVLCHCISKGTRTSGMSQKTAADFSLVIILKHYFYPLLIVHSSSVIKQKIEGTHFSDKPTWEGKQLTQNQKKKLNNFTAASAMMAEEPTTASPVKNIWTISENLDEEWLSLECLFPPSTIILYLATVWVKAKQTAFWSHIKLTNIHFQTRKIILVFMVSPKPASSVDAAPDCSVQACA